MRPQIPLMDRQGPSRQDAFPLSRSVKNRLEAKEIDLKNALRWEDDGGRSVTVEGPETTSKLFERIE
jgi:hypothetical protein